MKQYLFFFGIALLFFNSGEIFTKTEVGEPGYVLEHETEIAKSEPGPHEGGGNSTACKFFAGVKNSKLDFRKRILHPGSTIGYHLQEQEEIYYIDSGSGEMQMNGKTFPVKSGDAILTLAGSSHGLVPAGKEDLVVIIMFERKK